MSIRLKAGLAGMLMAACVGGTAYAQLPPGVNLPGGLSTTVTLPDGTKVVTTVTGATTLTIETSGGPNPPIKANITNFVANGATINYTGTVTVAGTTSAFDCQINTQTNSISGSQYCSTLFGGSSTTTPPTPGGTGTVTPPTTGGGTVVTTPGPNGTTINTITLPDGTTITVSNAQLNLIRNVEAEQFLLSLAAERLTINNVQSFIVARLQQLQAAGLAPGGVNIGSLRQYIGRAAGETGLTSGIWIDGSYTDLSDDRIGSGVDGDAKAIALGGDITGGAWNLGAFASYGTIDLSGVDAVNESDGFSYGLYGRFSFSPRLNVTGSIGAADQDVYFQRTDGTLVSTGDTERSSTYGLLGVDSILPLSDSFLMVPGLTISYAETETDAYLDSNGFPIGGVSSDTTVATAGATFYYTGGSLMPYLTLAASRQLNDVAGIDRSFGMVGAGVVLGVADGVDLVTGVQTLVSKEDENETSFSLTLRKGF